MCRFIWNGEEAGEDKAIVCKRFNACNNRMCRENWITTSWKDISQQFTDFLAVPIPRLCLMNWSRVKQIQVMIYFLIITQLFSYLNIRNIIKFTTKYVMDNRIIFCPVLLQPQNTCIHSSKRVLIIKIGLHKYFIKNGLNKF